MFKIKYQSDNIEINYRFFIQRHCTDSTLKRVIYRLIFIAKLNKPSLIKEDSRYHKLPVATAFQEVILVIRRCLMLFFFSLFVKLKCKFLLRITCLVSIC